MTTLLALASPILAVVALAYGTSLAVTFLKMKGLSNED